jgi:hypothetical protein
VPLLVRRLAVSRRVSGGHLLAKGSESEIAFETRSFLKESPIGLNPNKLKIEMIELGAFSPQKIAVNVQGITDINSYTRDRGHYGYEFFIDPRLSELEEELLVSKIISSIVGLGGEITLAQVVKPSLEDNYIKIISKSREMVSPS